MRSPYLQRIMNHQVQPTYYFPFWQDNNPLKFSSPSWKRPTSTHHRVSLSRHLIALPTSRPRLCHFSFELDAALGSVPIDTQANHAKTTAALSLVALRREGKYFTYKQIVYRFSTQRQSRSLLSRFVFFFSFFFSVVLFSFSFSFFIFHILPSFCATLLATRFLFLAATGFLQLFSGSRCPSPHVPWRSILTTKSTLMLGDGLFCTFYRRDETTSPLVSRKKQTLNLTASKRVVQVQNIWIRAGGEVSRRRTRPTELSNGSLDTDDTAMTFRRWRRRVPLKLRPEFDLALFTKILFLYPQIMLPDSVQHC